MLSSSSSLIATAVACIVATALDAIVVVDAAPVIAPTSKTLDTSMVRLDGGKDSAWTNDNSWYIINDSVMGGKSKGFTSFQSSPTSTRNAMKFSGTIKTQGGGFTLVRRDAQYDLNEFAGVVVTVEAQNYTPYDDGSFITGLHLQFGDSTSWYDYSSAFAVPLSTEPITTSVFLPFDSFDRGSSRGYGISDTSSLNPSAIDDISIYMLFQEGRFDVRIVSITAVTDDVSFAAPEVKFNTKQNVVDAIQNAIRVGGSLYDKSYKELCIAMYWSLLNTIVASSDYSANETIVNDSIKAVICAGLNHMVSNNMNSKTDQAWTLRFIMDAVKDDIMDQPRDNDVTWLPSASSVMKNSNRDVCTARTSVSPGKLIASLDTNQATLLPPTLPPTQKDIPKTGDESPPMKKCRNSKMVIYITKTDKKKKCRWVKNGKTIGVRKKRCRKVSPNGNKVHWNCQLACGKYAGVGKCKDRLPEKF